MIAAVLAALAVCLLLWSAFYRRNWHKGVGVQLSFPEPAVYCGQEFHLREIIENRKRLPVPVLEIAFRIGKGVQFIGVENITESDYLYKRDVFSLLGMERITRELRLTSVRRGHYVISQAEVSSWSLLFRSRYTCELPETPDIYVYAQRTDVGGILSSIVTILGETESSTKLYEDPFAFSQIREYTPTDPMKYVNWKASAKTGSLMVNSYTSVKSDRIRIFLDTEDRNIRKQEKLTEDGISVAATLLMKLLQKGLEVSLFVNAPGPSAAWTSFEKVRGRSAQKEIERYLTTDFAAAGSTDFTEMILQNLSPDEIPVIISKNASDPLFQAALAASSEGLPGIWVIPHEKREPVAYASSGSLTVLRREVRG